MNLVIVFAVLLFAIVIIETVLSATWSKYYFLYGVPIFVKEIEISKISETKQKVSEFINNMDSKKGFSKYKGKEIFDLDITEALSKTKTIDEKLYEMASLLC